jgi:putative MFS transporter
LIIKDLIKAFASPTVVIAGTGYLVDMFDLFAFNMLRVKSLKSLGLDPDAVTAVGVNIINAQLAGLILGAYIWGKLGDRFGRTRVLLGSILLYSITSLLTSMVQDPWQYGILRFLTGIGLAGELGAGITLISEEFSDKRRGLGVGIFIILGFVGVVLASFVAQTIDWRSCYVVGGLMGLALLFLRCRLHESILFSSTKHQTGIKYGGLTPILSNSGLRGKFVQGILLILPTVFVPQIVWSLSPEIAKAKGISGIDPATVLGFGYTMVIVGDFLAIYLAEKLKSRKRSISVFSSAGCVFFLVFLFCPFHSANEYYLWSSMLGMTFGTWVVGSTVIAESFGTNIRATAATTIPNFSRGCVILMNFALMALKPALGITNAMTCVGAVIFVLSIIAIYLTKETYGTDLTFVDGQKPKDVTKDLVLNNA